MRIFFSVKEIHLDMVNGDLSVLVPLDLKTKSGSEEEQLGRDILRFYTNEDSLSWDVMQGYLDVSRLKSLGVVFKLFITLKYIIILFRWASEYFPGPLTEYFFVPIVKIPFAYVSAITLKYSNTICYIII